MIDKAKKTSCVGCKACVVICPTHALTLQYDNEGFEYTSIDKKKCVECGLCEKVCPALCENRKFPKQKEYAARIKNMDVLMESSSGGVFSALAQKYIKNKGVIYGVVLDRNYKVVYARATSEQGVSKMRGSKYVDAFLNIEILKQLEKDILDNKEILFTGTPCEIEGIIRLFTLKKLNLEKVLWVDFTRCSGKISSLLWNDECKYYLNKGKIQEISFRNKNIGWERFQMYFKVDGKIYQKDFLLSRWNKLFEKAECKRKSCLKCKYDYGRSGADISIGDFWFDRKDIPKKWDDDKGISYVLVNTYKGYEKIQEIKDTLDIVPCNCKKKLKTEVVLDEKARSEFWDVYRKGGYKRICEVYTKITLKDRFLYGIIRPFLLKTKLLRIIKK